MASKRIKGITIELDANTKPLTEAVKKAEKEIGDAAYKLRDVNKLLKLDPKNVELLAQKQKALSEAIAGTKEKLEQEKLALQQLKEGPKTEETIRQQEALEREIVETTQSLQKLENEYKEFGSVSAQQTKQAGEAMQAAGQKIQDVGKGITSAGKALTTSVTAPIVGGFAASAKAAIDWETAFTGVQKTVDATEEEYEQLSEAIKEMSTRMASSKADIAAVMEIAGQLGVTGVENLKAFTETAVMLGDTTNLSAEDAATAFARILNITGDGYDKVSNMGSAVVDLGNNMATTESEIVEMANRLASAGTISGMTTQEILAMSAAMSSVGIQAEAGGTAMAQTMKGIQAAVSDFNMEDATEKDKEALETLAKVAGMTADEFAKKWGDKPMDAMTAFIKGLSNLKDAGEDTFATLDELGMSGIRQSNMLQSLALASDQLTNATDIANNAWQENTALSEEAQKRYATMQAKLTQLKEELTNLAITVGERLLPYIDKGIEYIDKLIKKFENMSDEELDAKIKMLAFVAAIGPVLMAIGSLVTGIGKVVWAIGTIKTAFGAGGALAGVSTFFTNIGTTISTGFASIQASVASFMAGIGGTIVTALGEIALAVATFFAGAELGKTIGEGLFPEDAELYEHYSGIQGTLELLKDTVTTIWSQIVEGCQIYWNNLKEAATLLVEEVTEKWTNFKDASVVLWGAIKDAVTEKVNSLVESVKTAFAGLEMFFKDIIGRAKQWGADLINGIRDGIMSGIQNVKDAATAVGNAIKERLHFSEPDVGPLSDFNTWMPDMMKQMAEQINAGIPGVETAIQGTASAIKNGITAPDYSGQLASINNGIGQLAAAGGGNIEIPVYIGQTKFAQAVVEANQRNQYRNGGR
ncbi:MAG: phage tail tape measure protein [Oscillospiraceae bacterium]|nr:phage tail tape measure protein [Oscillospiraceae bacterium]